MKTLLTLIMTMAAFWAPGEAISMEEEQQYVVTKLENGGEAMEKAWVVDKRIIFTSPREVEAYVSRNDGLFTGNGTVARFLVRNNLRWIKVYVTDKDMKVSRDVPQVIEYAYFGLNVAIQQAGGLDKYIETLRKAAPDRSPVRQAMREGI